MTYSTFKKYTFACSKCDHSFEAMMWVEDGVPTGKACPKCESLEFPVMIDNTGARIHINTRDDWSKKIPGGWTNFLDEFSKRHSKYGRTVNSHKTGLTDI